MGRSSVFSLEQIYRKQITQTWSKIPEVFRYVNSIGSQGPAFGYFAGGKASGPLRSTVDRVDYSNDNTTATAKGALPAVRYYMAPAGNRSYGWFTGGNSAGYPTNSLSTVYRLDYGSDSTSPTPKGNLSIIRAMHAGTGNENYGYFAAGDATTHSSNPVYSTIDRIDYANDTATSTPKGLLNEAKTMLGAAGNQSYGYFAGGASSLSNIDRIDYGNDTATASPKGNLGVGVRLVGGTSNPSYAYFGGGYPNPGSTQIQRLDFANDTGAPLHGTLSTGGLYQNSATGNASFGYWGGADGSNGNYGTIIQRLDYSNDTGVAGTRGNLSSSASFGTAGVSARDYALPTMPTPATRIESGTPTPVGTDYGYIGGGHGPTRFSSIDRIDIANDTATALVKGKMTVERRGHGGTGSLTHGYQGGYDVNAGNSSVSRIDFSNDTADAAVVGRMSFASPGGAAASGNKDFGYFVGGGGNLSNVSRVDYSNDSSTQSPKGPLAAGMWYLGGTGNQSFGYFVGGYPAISTLNRIDYGNDTATAATKGNQSTGRYGQGASGNASYAYFSGGRSSSVLSTVDRLDYSNDTPNMVVKGPLSSTGYYISSFGNSEYGWHCARRPNKTVVDRIDFANDTATASIRGPLTAIRKYAAASSSRQYNNPTTISTPSVVDKGAEGYTTSSLGPAYGYHIGGMIPASG